MNVMAVCTHYMCACDVCTHMIHLMCVDHLQTRVGYMQGDLSEKMGDMQCTDTVSSGIGT